MYQEDAEARDHRRALIEAEDDRKKGVYGTPPLGPNEFPYEALYVCATTDEFGQQRWFVEDGNADWISDPFDTRDLAEAELARLQEAA